MEQPDSTLSGQMEGVTIAGSSEAHLTTPIETLPDDVLSLIFELATSGDFILFKAIGGFELAFVFTISHVCRAWRQIVTSFPHLWSNVSLCVGGSLKMLTPGDFASRSEYRKFYYAGPGLFPETIASHFEYLDHILTMSRACPLSLKLKTLNQSEKTHIFLSPAAAQIHRWQNLELDSRLSPFVPLGAPNLRTLTVNEVFSPSGISSFSKFLSHAPELREIKFSSSSYACQRYMTYGDSFPWTQLETLSGVSDIRWLVGTSACLQHLQTLTIENPFTWSRSSLVNLMRMEFPRLHTFTLSCRSDYGFGLVLSLLHLPSLRNLRLRNMECISSSTFLTVLEALLSNSSPVIQELEIHGHPNNDQGDTLTSSLLALFPKLESLHWDYQNDHMNGISLFKLLAEITRLRPPGSTGSLDDGEVEFRYLPQLRSLKAGGFAARGAQSEEILDVLESRRDLEHIEITLCGQDITWDMERWEGIKRRGVVMSVQSRNRDGALTSQLLL